MSAPEDHAEFLQQFESARLSAQDFSHTQHVRMAWLYLRANALPEALIKIREGIRHFANVHGADGLYHETITMAYGLIIESRLAGCEGDWQQFQDANPDLFQSGLALLRDYYKAETLESEQAKQCFLWPDRLKQRA